MQIKKFEANNMTEGLKLVKKEFGSDAVILSVKSGGKESGLFGKMLKRKIEITAAIDDMKGFNGYNSRKKISKNIDIKISDETDIGNKNYQSNIIEKDYKIEKYTYPKNMNVKESITDKKLLKRLFSIHEQLRWHKVDEDITIDIIKNMRKILSKKEIANNINIKKFIVNNIIERNAISKKIELERGKRKIVAFFGTAGCGKTTTIQKIATSAHISKKIDSVGLISVYDKKIGAMDKLKIYGNAMGMNHKVVTNNKEIYKAINEMSEHELVLIDTPGICQNDENEINKLNNVISRISSVENLLVISSSKQGEIIKDIVKNFSIFKISGLIFTKIDECITLGNILNAAILCNLPLYYFTNGQSIPEDIESAKIEKLIDMIVAPDNYDLILSLSTEIFAESFEIFKNILNGEYQNEIDKIRSDGDRYMIKNNVYNVYR